MGANASINISSTSGFKFGVNIQTVSSALNSQIKLGPGTEFVSSKIHDAPNYSRKYLHVRLS